MFYIYIQRNNERIVWSSRFKRWTLLITRGSYYKSEVKAKKLLEELSHRYPSEDIKIGVIE